MLRCSFITLAAGAAAISVGDKLPSVNLQQVVDGEFNPPSTINLAERAEGRAIILVGLPGAFTPTWCACAREGAWMCA